MNLYICIKELNYEEVSSVRPRIVYKEDRNWLNYELVDNDIKNYSIAKLFNYYADTFFDCHRKREIERENINNNIAEILSQHHLIIGFDTVEEYEKFKRKLKILKPFAKIKDLILYFIIIHSFLFVASMGLLPIAFFSISERAGEIYYIFIILTILGLAYFEKYFFKSRRKELGKERFNFSC